MENYFYSLDILYHARGEFMYGYWGKILRVNLSTGKISVEEFGEEFVKKWLGTRGFAIYSFGNIKEKSLGEIWSGKDYAWFRFIVKNAIYPSCGDCL